MPKLIQDKYMKRSGVRSVVVLTAGCICLGCSLSALSAEDQTESAPKLQMAPVRLQHRPYGMVNYQLLYTKGRGSKSLEQRFGLVAGLRGSAESFIWQPWLIQVGARMDARAGYSTTDATINDAKWKRTAQLNSTTLTGNLRFNFLAKSRFPVSVGLTRTDDRNDIGVLNTRLTTLTDQLEIDHSYRTYFNSQGYSLRYQKTRMETQDALVDRRDSFNFNLSLRPFRWQGLQVDYLNSHSDSMRTGYSIWDTSLIGRHTFQPSPRFSIATMSSRVRNTVRLTNSLSREAIQLSSAATWRPFNRLTFNAGVRLFDSNNGSLSSSYTGANLGFNYAWSNWLRVYGSATVYDDNNGTQTVSSTSLGNLSAAVFYKTDPIKLGSYTYSRLAIANLSNNARSTSNISSNSSSTTITQNLSTRLQHGLSRRTPWNEGSFSTDFNQGLSSNMTSKGNQSWGLTHGAAFGWRRGGGGINLNATDTRSFTGNKPYNQSVNLQGNQVERIKGGGSLSGNVTVNANRGGSKDSPVYRSLTSSAGLDYTNGYLFKVPRLMFRSSLRVLSADLAQENMANSLQDQGKIFWENLLTYSIGKLKTETKGVLEEVQSSRRISILFQVTREF